MNVQFDRAEAKAYVDEIYRKVAKRWQEWKEKGFSKKFADVRPLLWI
jgi:hypothetical protein